MIPSRTQPSADIRTLHRSLDHTVICPIIRLHVETHSCTSPELDHSFTSEKNAYSLTSVICPLFSATTSFHLLYVHTINHYFHHVGVNINKDDFRWLGWMDTQTVTYISHEQYVYLGAHLLIHDVSHDVWKHNVMCIHTNKVD